MKQLVCEMCGSTDIVKQDGVFVCQSCGMKYSLEDAKKMMIEGTVEVKGNVKVENVVQVDNLLDLAHSSFNSKNYAQAEEFCNQAIAIDAANYGAWKLKGEAINYQISTSNQRILEVYNCIMTSYKVLDDAGKDEHREEIMDSLRTCLEGEIDFWLEQFENKRPTDNMLQKVKKTFIDCGSKVINSFTELGYSEEEAEEYKEYIKKHFVEKANEICESAWDTTVAYNYYGKNGSFYLDDCYRGSDEYRPNEKTMMTFINETDNLIGLLQFTEDYFEDSPDELKLKIYDNIVFYEQKVSGARSFKLIETTTTNGYGAVTNRTIKWEHDKSLTSEAIAGRNKIIAEYEEKILNLKIKIAKESPEKREELLNEYQEEIDAIDLNAKPKPKLSIPALIFTIINVAACLILLRTDEGLDDLMFLTILTGIVGIISFVVMIVSLFKSYANSKKAIKNSLAKRTSLEEDLKKIKEGL